MNKSHPAPAKPDAIPPAGPNGNDTWLTLLVHGVGGQRPGDMIESVTGAIRAVRPSFPRNDESTVVRLPDKAASDGWYPLSTREFQLSSGVQAVFGEVYWADLSRIRAGTFDFVIGVFRLIFGLRYVSDQAAAQPGRAALVLRWLLYVTILVARGPFLAAVIMGIVFSVPPAAQWALKTLGLPGDWLETTCCFWGLAVAVICAGGGMAVRTATRGFHFAALGVSLFVCGLLLTRSYYLGFGVNHLEGLYGVPLRDNPAYFFAAVIWLTDTLRDVAFVCLGLSLVALIPATLTAARHVRAALHIAYLAAAVQLLLWQWVLAPLEFVPDAGFETIVKLREDGDEPPAAVQNVGARMLAVFSVGLVVFATWAARQRWAGMHPDPEWPARFPPRLIVGFAAQSWLLLVSLYLIAQALLIEVQEHSEPWGETVNWLLGLSDEPIRWFAPLVWLVAAAFFCYTLTSEAMARQGLHVVTDVVNHFYRPSEGFPVRRQIEARFHTVFARLVQELHPNRVTVVAHSQGTMITFNALAKICSEEWFQPYADKLRIDVVTVGSPLTHLYQHYFPNEYPPRDDDKWSALAKVTCWKNLFRVDDFVGTFIAEGCGDPQQQAKPKNIPAMPGGHTDYWEPDIFKDLMNVLPW